MKYKRGSAPQYKRHKPPQSFVPLIRFLQEAPLPEKALRKLKDAEYVATDKCEICGSYTLKLYRRYIRGVPPQGFMVCANPNCEAYGTVIPV